MIWLSPVYQSPNADNGYDISDYQAIMEEFGTMEDFDRMLAGRPDQRGIRLVMDLVVNHTSDEHRLVCGEPQVQGQSLPGLLYLERGQRTGKSPTTGVPASAAPPGSTMPSTDMYYLHLFAEKQPDLNWDNPAVRHAVFQMMDWWCKKGIDGFRMDVISMISKDPALPDGPVNGSGYGDYGPYAVNGPHVHEYLQEMNREVLSKYDLMTVGECSGVTIEEAKKYANQDGRELNMVFQFEHMDLDGGESFKWNDRKINLVELKQVLTKWQTELAGTAWNSLFWDNHDQPRIVSRLGDDSTREYREASAKMLALCLHMMQGTPYVYQGEELGMTNVPFETLEDFRDIESINAYHELTESGQVSPEDMMRFLRYKSRDNARTPMQWDDSENAGFTEGTPWIMVNPNYKEINAKEQLARPDSVFHFYQKLIRLRKEREIIPYGEYELLLPEDPDLYVYTRALGEHKLLVICNFRKEEKEFTLPEGFDPGMGEILVGNYPDRELGETMTLKAYEALAILW